MKSASGFTLIELMITVAIFAILIGIGVPSYQHTVQQSRIDDATSLINSTLSYAKNTAIAHNRPLYMTVSSNTLTLATSTDALAEIINKTIIDTDSASNLSFTTPNTAITFRANGTVVNSTTATSTVIRYNLGGQGIDITVSNNGDTSVAALKSSSY